jgi:hypothetical protein
MLRRVGVLRGDPSVIRQIIRAGASPITCMSCLSCLSPHVNLLVTIIFFLSFLLKVAVARRHTSVSLPLTEVCTLFSSDTYNVLTGAAIGSRYFTLG